MFGLKLRLKGCESRPWNRHWKATFSLLTPPRPLSYTRNILTFFISTTWLWFPISLDLLEIQS